MIFLTDWRPSIGWGCRCRPTGLGRGRWCLRGGLLFGLAGGDLIEVGFGLVFAELFGQGLGQFSVAIDAVTEPVLDPAVVRGRVGS